MTEQISVTRGFDAPRELVWHVVTSREHFAEWFGTDAVEVPLDTLEWEPSVGARWAGQMRLPDGSLKHWLGEFVAIEPPERFVFSLTDNPDEPDVLAPVAIELAEVEGDEGQPRTRLSLTQPTPGWPEETRAALVGGYNSFFDTMARIIERVR